MYQAVSRCNLLRGETSPECHTCRSPREMTTLFVGTGDAIDPNMPTYSKPLHEVALLLTLKTAKTEAGRKVQEHVLFRVECAMWIQSEIKG